MRLIDVKKYEQTYHISNTLICGLSKVVKISVVRKNAMLSHKKNQFDLLCYHMTER